MNQLYGGLEAGGTKFVCLVSAGPDEVVDEIRIPTTLPDETIARVIAFFEPHRRQGRLAAIGVGSFGPVDLDCASPTFGTITTTPKPGWSQVDLRGRLERALGLPVAFDTDVNAAALGERCWTPGNQALDPFVYVTVGTGIGAGVLANDRPLHGLVHTEVGHGLIPHDWRRDPFPGLCPFHGDCWEGLASGPAMAARWGQPPESLPAEHPGWALEAHYISLAVVNLICAYSPRRIVLGGGVAQHPGLHAAVQARVQKLLNGYIHSPLILEHMDEYLVPPSLGKRSGVLGAIALAMNVIPQ